MMRHIVSVKLAALSSSWGRFVAMGVLCVTLLLYANVARASAAPAAEPPAAPAAASPAPVAAAEPAATNPDGTPVVSAKSIQEYSYFRLRPTMLANVRGEPPGLLQLEVEFVAPNYEAAKAIRYHQAQLQHAILEIVNNKERNDLLTNDGREAVRTAIFDAANAIMQREEKKPLVVRVLFTKFVAK